MNETTQSVVVRPGTSGFEDRFELTLDVCACPGCRQEGTLGIVLGADMQGTAADWGVVQFCTPGCAREFFSGDYLDVLVEDEDGDLRMDGTTILWDRPRLATVLVDGSPWAVELGHDLSAAREKVTETFDDPAFEAQAEFEDVEVRYERLD